MLLVDSHAFHSKVHNFFKYPRAPRSLPMVPHRWTLKWDLGVALKPHDMPLKLTPQILLCSNFVTAMFATK